VEITAELIAPCEPIVLFELVDDLERYPEWLEIVPAASVVEEGVWNIDLRGRVGPFARTKRLRMARTVWQPPTRVVFERDELDDRDHSTWRLSIDIEQIDIGSQLEMSLFYSGSLLQPVVERLLRDEIELSRARLLNLVSPQIA